MQGWGIKAEWAERKWASLGGGPSGLIPSRTGRHGRAARASPDALGSGHAGMFPRYARMFRRAGRKAGFSRPLAAALLEWLELNENR